MAPTVPRLGVALAALALGACAAPPTAPAPSATQAARGDYGPRYAAAAYGRQEEVLPFQIDALIGMRRMRADAAWDPLDEQFELGAALRAPIAASEFVSFDSAIRYSFDSTERAGTQVDTQTIEIDLGLVLSLAPPGALVQPYLGAGLAVLFTDFEIDPANGNYARDREADLGRYVRGGLSVEFSPAQLIGVELRYLDGGDANLAGRSASVDSFGVALTFGARF